MSDIILSYNPMYIIDSTFTYGDWHKLFIGDWGYTKINSSLDSGMN